MVSVFRSFLRYATLNAALRTNGKCIEPYFGLNQRFLNEYYSVALKNHAADAWIQANIEAMIARCEVLPVTVTILRFGHRLKLANQLSLWDAFVVAAALEAGCSILYSEDLQHGQVFDGRLEVVNPFL